MLFYEGQPILIARRISSTGIIVFVVSHLNELDTETYALFGHKEIVDSIINIGLTIVTLLFKYTTNIVKNSTMLHTKPLTDRRINGEEKKQA